ncbi:antA/AntB antirepressor family protein [Streptococcus thermophilus]
MVEYGFTENQDFLLLKNVKQTGRGGHNKIDHVLKLDMAKEIAMI